MSVEEARQRLWDSLMDFEDSFSDDLDRLILEVQEDVVRRIFDGDDWPWVIDHVPNGDEVLTWLKETADEVAH